jgi:hypothetical protein
VTVNAKDQIVRNILTDCVPLDVYRSILWRSETRNTAGGTRTVIEYFGPDVPEPGYHPGRFFRAIFWKDFAQTVAKKLDCYLTTEELVCWYTAPGVPIRFSSLGTKYLPRARLANAPESVEQFIDLLRQELDDVRVVRDAENPSVIHLVDEPLLKIRSYFMDRDVGLEYSGTLDGMLARLETMYPDLGLTTKLSQSVGLTTRVVEIVGDKVTLVRIAVKNKPVRHVLTEYLPLKRYQRILWESHTVQKDGKYMSWVVYSGPAPTPAKPARAPAEHKPQKQKEDAQRMRAVRNLASPMTVCSTTMAGLGLLRELSDAFARKKEGGVITSDLTTRWFPFAEFFAGRFGGVLHTSVPASERRVVESRMGGPLREVLLGSRNGAAASFLHRGVPWGY